MARYVWKMCVLQHTFYKMHQSATESSELNITLSPSTPTLSSGNFYIALVLVLLLGFSRVNTNHSFLSSDSGLFRAADIANFQRQSQNIPARVELQVRSLKMNPLIV